MKLPQSELLKNVKRSILAIIVASYIGVLGYLTWNYIHLAPSRVTSAMLNTISEKSNYSAAYKLTAKSFQQNVPATNFDSYFQPLAGSKAKYTVVSQTVNGKYAVVSGVVEDLHGANYLYEFHLTKQGSQWQVDATNANKL